jgi:hypothetical protein
MSTPNSHDDFGRCSRPYEAKSLAGGYSIAWVPFPRPKKKAPESTGADAQLDERSRYGFRSMQPWKSGLTCSLFGTGMFSSVP